ncbi:penicillin-binding protein 2 [Enterococcus thailandicus]|uniref:peptidoglycan D,D-transpeptidase FtsI family protein n=1 Tax=Enterococcus TaxID=1350 RepID=UPI0022EC128E|nr:penicillin-binding protein 2 [Enterococcus thailandicus]MDA3964002.1 penicillin-binding protein 2 [Enterococcus thailandicus]MDK4353314.1 penicillin-binding protein 2 [Enterococcus thailandicus]MDT2733566.1 penicillin-binding protein 2 [Enterococcus thailandicus]
MMKDFMKKIKNNSWFDKLKKGTQEPRNKPYRRSHVPFRLNVLFFIIFTLFVALIARLGYLQIVDGETMEAKVKSSSTITVQESSPRGMIYDATGKALVKNQANQAITFTRGSQMTSTDLLKLTKKLNELIDVPADDSLTARDKKDFWLADADHLAEATKRLSSTEKQLDNSQQYAATVEKVTDEEINFNEEQLKMATIFKRMNSAYELNTVYIKNSGVTDRELAVVAENASELPGVSTGVDWTREYLAADSMKSILGSVTTEKQGLPADDIDAYLAKGYSRNDRVGQSYLEKQYEDVLQGTKTQYEVKLDNEGNVSSQKEIFAGEKGSNLKLSIDAEFQNKVDEILKRNFQALVDSGKAKYSPGAYAVAMNPQTGEVLALAGFSHEESSGEITENALGTITNAFTPGSVVKAGTLAAGWKTGVISGNQVLIDEPIQLQGSAEKSSVFNRSGQIALNAVKALELSSNTYMIKVALKMLGLEYTPNMGLPGLDEQTKAYDELRTSFKEFGLGTTTGIDLPNESAGISRSVDFMKKFNADNDGEWYTSGNFTDLAFGQFDTYTPIQLAQYASTVANGGKRIQPHIVSGIYGNDENGNLGEQKKKIETTVQNEVNISPENMAILREGFYQVVHGTEGYTTGKPLAGAKMDLSAKTGTAETVAEGHPDITTVNSNVVAYGPTDNPEIAISVVLPNLTDEKDHMNLTIAKEITDAYYDMYLAN